jgi:hypothetical protein
MTVEISNLVIGSLIQLLITIFVGAFLLHLASKILDFKNISFGKAFTVVIIGGIVFILFRYILSSILSLYPLIGIFLGLIIYWYFIKTIYDVTWIKSILAWFISIVVSYVITIIILLILGISIFFFSSI